MDLSRFGKLVVNTYLTENYTQYTYYPTEAFIFYLLRINLIIPVIFSSLQMMPLENNMEHPRHFLGVCGVLNKGMSVVSMVYILVGFIGYLTYGDSVKDNIVASLPIQDPYVIPTYYYRSLNTATS